MRPEAITASITWRIVHNPFVFVVSKDCLANIGGGDKSWNYDHSAALSVHKLAFLGLSQREIWW